MSVFAIQRQAGPQAPIELVSVGFLNTLMSASKQVTCSGDELCLCRNLLWAEKSLQLQSVWQDGRWRLFEVGPSLSGWWG